MDYEQVVELLQKAGLPYAYDHFEEGEAPDPPFLVYLYPGSHNFTADGKVYFKVRQLDVELYTDMKDPVLEERLEQVRWKVMPAGPQRRENCGTLDVPAEERRVLRLVRASHPATA